MSKKTVTGEDGKTYTVKEKKAWYKKWWVWVIVALLVIGIGGSMGDDDSESSDTTSSSTQTKSKAKSSLKDQYKVGESATYNGYSFKVNSVKYWGGDDMDTPDSGKQFVIANVTITNKGDSKQDYNQFDFHLNADGNSQDFDEVLINDKYSDGTLDSGTLDKGAKVTGNLIGQAKTDSKLKLEYQPSFFDDETVDVALN